MHELFEFILSNFFVVNIILLVIQTATPKTISTRIHVVTKIKLVRIVTIQTIKTSIEISAVDTLIAVFYFQRIQTVNAILAMK